MKDGLFWLSIVISPQLILWHHANQRKWHCDVIFVNCSCMCKLAQCWSSLVNSNHEYPFPTTWYWQLRMWEIGVFCEFKPCYMWHLCSCCISHWCAICNIMHSSLEHVKPGSNCTFLWPIIPALQPVISAYDAKEDDRISAVMMYCVDFLAWQISQWW